MTSVRTLLCLTTIFWLLTMTACSKGCQKPQSPKDPLAKPPTDQPINPAHGEKQGDSLISTFESLDFSGLSQAQTTALIKLFNDEICPCGCPTTFAQCLQLKDGCKPGQLLAQWTVLQSKLGTPERMLLQAVSEEISSGYLAEHKTIDTKGAYHKGHKNAPITVVEFADFECPSCKFAAKQFKEFMNEHPNDIQAYFMHFPLSSHANAEAAAIAAEAAGLQGKFWDMHDALFAHNGALTQPVIQEIASKLFNPTQMVQFNKDLKNDALKNKILEQKKYGTEVLNLMATPSFFVNGRPYNLSFAKDGFEVRLAMEKARAQIDCQAK